MKTMSSYWIAMMRKRMMVTFETTLMAITCVLYGRLPRYMGIYLCE